MHSGRMSGRLPNPAKPPSLRRLRGPDGQSRILDAAGGDPTEEGRLFRLSSNFVKLEEIGRGSYATVHMVRSRSRPSRQR